MICLGPSAHFLNSFLWDHTLLYMIDLKGPFRWTFDRISTKTLTQDPGSWVQSPGSWIKEPASWIQEPGTWIQDPRPRNPDAGSRILDPVRRRSTEFHRMRWISMDFGRIRWNVDGSSTEINGVRRNLEGIRRNLGGISRNSRLVRL